MITLAVAEYPVPMSKIQLKKKIQKASFTRRPHRTLLMLMYSCDLRMGETIAPPPVDIKSDEGLIIISGGKGVKDRRVPQSSRLWTALRKYYEAYHSRQYLFKGQKGGQYTYGGINIKSISTAHYMPNVISIGVKYAFINKL